MPLAYWTHTPHPFLIRFSETVGIRYYGLAYLLGFLAAGWLLRTYARAGRSTLPAAKVGDLMVALVVGVLLGGRLGYFLFYQLGAVTTDPLAIFRVWEGGMASHGGFIGVAVAMAWFSRAEKIPWVNLADLIASATSIGLLLGRLANYMNGELWGKPATVSWAVVFSATGGGPLPRHPSQLYEAALEGALLLGFAQWRFWKTDVVRAHPGRLAGEYLVGYAAVRIVCELFREPDVGISLIFGLSRGMFYSVFLAAGGLALILRRPPSLS